MRKIYRMTTTNEALPQTDEMCGGWPRAWSSGQLRLGKETNESVSVMWPHKAGS